MSKASSRPGTAVPPLSRHRKPSTRADGHFARLARVRFLTLPPSRQDSRSRMAGGEDRLGTDSIYMATHYTYSSIYISAYIHMCMGTRCDP